MRLTELVVINEVTNYMVLRDLQIEDAGFMYEWMQDPDIIKYMDTDFSSKTLEDCERFIRNSWNDNKNIHKAIVEDNEYMGTVSLKNIEENKAEFAITIRKEAMGKGISSDAMNEIIRFGFKEVGLNQIYWYVKPNNKRAIRFYDKNKFKRIDKKVNDYIWYRVTACEYMV